MKGKATRKQNATARQKCGDGFNEGRAEGSSNIQPPTNPRIITPSKCVMAPPNNNVRPRPSRPRSFPTSQKTHCTKPRMVKKIIGKVLPSHWTYFWVAGKSSKPRRVNDTTGRQLFPARFNEARAAIRKNSIQVGQNLVTNSST